MKNHATVELGAPATWDAFAFRHPLASRPVKGKKFLAADLGLTAMEISVNHLPPQAAVPFLHRHRAHEELYVFLEGEGEFLVDGERFPVRAGSAVRVAPPAARSWRNTGDVPLVYLVVQATAGTLAAQGIADGEPCGGNPWVA